MAVDQRHCWRDTSSGWWIEEWKSDRTTRPTQCRILYQDWLRLHCDSNGHVIITFYHTTLAPSAYMSRVQFAIGSVILSLDICQDKYHIHLSHDPLLLCFIILSPTLCHMPLCLLIFGPLLFPWQTFPFVLADSFVLMTHFISGPADQSWSCCCCIC